MTTPRLAVAALCLLGLTGACAVERTATPAPAPEVAESSPAGGSGTHPASILDLEVRTLEEQPLRLAEFRGKALLIVNTASHCGYTPQYEGLEALWRRYKDRGLVVIGFPSNDFGAQEPGSAKEIRDFCATRFDVSFPMMAKVHTKGPDRAPIYRLLTEGAPEGMGGEIQWNFTKFLVDPEGRVVGRFEPAIEPLGVEVVGAVESVLPG